MTESCCFDCLSGDVTVKLIDECGHEFYFCAVDWAAQQEFRERLMSMLSDATARLAEFLAVNSG